MKINPGTTSAPAPRQTSIEPSPPGGEQEIRAPTSSGSSFEPTSERKAQRAVTADGFTRPEQDVQSTFRQQFGALAADKKGFHDTMRAVFGPGYDTRKAEQYRQQALKGDFGWLPPVKQVEPEALGGANGAYDSETGTVLLNRTLDPATAASTYV